MPTAHSFRHEGQDYTIDLEQTLYGKALQQQCLLIFYKGKPLVYPYPLCDFEKLVAHLGYKRTHHSYLAFFPAIVDYKKPNAIFSNGEKVPVSEKYLPAVKAHLEKLRLEASSKGLPPPSAPPVSPA